MSLGGIYYALPKTSIRFLQPPSKTPFQVGEAGYCKEGEDYDSLDYEGRQLFFYFVPSTSNTKKRENIFMWFFPCGFFDVTIYQFGFFYMCLYIDTFHQTSKLTII